MRILLITCIFLSGLLLGCGDSILQPIEIGNPPVISGLQASYPQGEQFVTVQWDDVDAQRKQGVLYYLLFRTSTVDKNGTPVGFITDSLNLISTDSVRIHDVIGVENSVYYYYMIAVTRFKGELVYGLPSNIDSAFVSSGVAFSINRGALFTADSLCTLLIKDAFNQIKSFQLTDSFTIDGLGKPIPQFNASSHPQNANKVTKSFLGSDIASEHTIAPWVLKQGGGAKYAAFQATLMSGTVLTFVDDIAIEPYRIEIKLRNETFGPAKSMIELPYERYRLASDANSGKFKTVVIGKPWVHFSVQNFSDSTILPDFDYWLAFPESLQTMTYQQKWLETSPQHAKLTDVGRFHDDRFVYSYVFHPDSQQASQTLAAVNLTKPIGTKPTPLDPERSSLGAYFGSASQTPVSVPDTATNKQNYLFELVKRLGAKTAGQKEFAVVLRFKGKAFGDVRTIFTHPNVARNGHVYTILDLYPPTTVIDKFEFDIPKQGSIIQGIFNFSTNTNGGNPFAGTTEASNRGYCQDGGYGNIVAIQLVVAEMPKNMVWTATSSKTLSLESMLSFRHKTFTFPISAPANSFFPVEWNNIDMAGWNSGDYLVSIVAEDEFGNKDFSPYDVKNGDKSITNPTRYTFLTGASEL